MRHLRVVELVIDTSDEAQASDMNIITETFSGQEGISLDLESLDADRAKIVIRAYDDVLTERARSVLDAAGRYVTNHAVVSEDV